MTIALFHGMGSLGRKDHTYALIAAEVFQLLFASSFAAVFESACVTCTTSLTYTFCCAALGAGIVKIALAEFLLRWYICRRAREG